MKQKILIIMRIGFEKMVKRKEMRTARNIFIFNLALSDLLMAVTIPMTLMDGLLRSWNLPDSYVACRWVLEHKF